MLLLRLLLVLVAMRAIGGGKMRVAAHGYGAVHVVQHVVADAAEDRPSQTAQTARPEHHHRRVLLLRQLHDRLARILAELHHHPPGHLFHSDERRNTINIVIVISPCNQTRLYCCNSAGFTHKINKLLTV